MAKKKTTNQTPLPHQEQPQEQPQPKRKQGRPRKPLTPAQEALKARREEKKAQKAAELAARPKAKIGRPLKLDQDPEITDRLVAVLNAMDNGLSNEDRLSRALKSGSPLELAVEYAGINRYTLHEWQARYRDDPENTPPKIIEFLNVAHSIKAARAIWLQEQWLKIIKNGKGNFVPICTMLERLFNEFYSQNRVAKEQSTTVVTNIQTGEAQVAAAQYTDLTAEYRKQLDEQKTQQPAIDATPIEEEE